MTRIYPVVGTVAWDEVLGRVGQMVKSIPSPGERFEFNSMYTGQLRGLGVGVD